MERLSYLPINNHPPSVYEFYKCRCGKVVAGSVRYGGMVGIVYGVQTLWSMIPDSFSSPKKWKSQEDNSLIAYLIEKTNYLHTQTYKQMQIPPTCLGCRLP